ncbi:MAG: transglycosylase domain-containing protein [Pseudomonadota bacterium]
MRWLWIAAAAVIALIALDRLFPPDLARFRSTSVLITDRDGVLLRPFITADGMWRFATARDQVDPAYVAMLLAVEDRRFFAHPGVDPLALLRATAQLARHGRVISGGSTITMQVARLLMPHRHGVAGKLQDLVRALQLELRYGKDDILTMYLTLAPYGGNIEGVRAASRIYFGHEPSRLTPVESALLVALPQRPSRLRPDRFPARAAAAQRRVLDRLVAAGALDPRAHDEAVESLVALDRQALPFAAAHLAQRPEARGAVGRHGADHARCAAAARGRGAGGARGAVARRRRQFGGAGGRQSRACGAGLSRRRRLLRSERPSRSGPGAALAGLDPEAVHLRAGV